ncbi:gliding motility-associated C-terminal domain-containing protein [Fibrisoma montanum]|uniref:Gliding motility-associated C-terminal domain-containing protein n=1 Tax=Fibrisoma montanum TaxID=2305895 RepID=A0A418LVT5_9BACT|nr:gliding motility-associated C-terminal domain-containing protein [Fibrisoma montanum]RIV17361.1 gliding motility-associated C-terminal domain-containing protein [Fibrisoma montanum]
MIRLLVLGWVYLFAGVVGYSQPVDCSNIGFEEGTFRGWERWIGYPADSAQKVFFISLRSGSEHLGTGLFGHTITKITDGYDPFINEQIPVVAPGSQHSVRLGTSAIGSTADQLRSTLRVSADAPLLLYRFAVVLQNPNHKPYQQPAFRLLIRTPQGDTIPCGYYQASASNQTAGFTKQGGLIYLNWTNCIVDLRPYIGQQLTIEVTAHGCTDGAHFGYAYFDARCLEAAVTAASFCSQQDTTTTLSAPTGFDQYQWSTGDTTATITVVPRIGDRYWVKVRSQSTLRSDCSVELMLPYEVKEELVPTSQTISLCAGESYQVGDSVYTRSGTYRTVIKRPAPLCDSVIVTKLTVLPPVNSTQSKTICIGNTLVVGDSTYTTTGTYQTRFRRAAPLCDSVVTTHLVVQQVDLGSFQDTLVVQGDSIQLKALVPGGANYAYSWSPTDGLSCPTCAVTWAKPGQTTQYRLTARIADSGCEASQTMRVQVVPCTINVPNSFSPNGDGINDQFTILSSPCVKQVRLLIVYNRWGQVIFYGTNESNQNSSVSWDGTFRGEAADVGVYPYQILFESPVGGVRKHSGALLLLR